MKILAVCPYDIDRPGGVQRHILDTGAALAELGHEVTVLAPRTTTPPKASPPGVVIERLGRARAIGLGGTRFEISLPLGAERRRLRALIRNGGFDVGWFHTVWTPFLAPMALAYFSGPAVCMFHDTPGNGLVGRTMAAIFRRISRPLLPRFGAILTPSRTPQAHLAGAQRMEVFAPCTDLRRFHDAASQPGFADGRINILYLGRLEPRKGAHILLQAYRQLCDSVQGVRLILAGAGPEEHALRAYAAEHHLSGVVFAGAPADAAPWFAASDIFCAPSLYGESFGIVLTEAMSAGKPVVAAANAGYRTVLTDQAARFLVPPGDVTALATALGILAQDEALRARLGAWGRAAAPAYDCRALAPRLVEIFRDTVIAHRLKTTGLRARSAT
jgi:phosphatidylinositol alpha-mannosyltransferase